MRSFIILALAAVAFAAPKTVQDNAEVFRLYILEQNIIVSESVELHDHYAKVSMPAHNGLVPTTVLTDHKSELTMRMMPERKVCYLTAQDPAALPSKDQWEVPTTESIWTNVPNDTYVYRMDGRVTDLSILTTEMKELCGNFPVIKLKMDAHQGELRKTVLFQEAHVPNPACSLETCPIPYQGQLCSAIDNHCHYIMMCHMETDTTGKPVSVCSQDHKFGTVRCCTTCCLMQVPGPTCLPYCMSPEAEEWEKCEGYGY